ncbi:hypothetical protein P886_4537 [Alteromonadaceae bacterium 2753L.S.0a.02]|nr:hypothetical protein P886_4537 [Alteromonadaceae bacterium 2753L.S.0a.02]
MKYLVFLFSLSVALFSHAQSYTGTIERIQRNGELIYIDGSPYKFSHATIVRINKKYEKGIHILRPGLRVSYDIKQLDNGVRFLSVVNVTLSKEEADSIVNE